MTLKKRFAAGCRGDLIALLAGALLTLAFAPFNFYPLAILSPALLLCTWLNVNAKKAFYRGWLYGLGLFGTGIYWVYISIHTYGHASIVLSLFITLGLINIVALFPAFTGYLLNHFFPNQNRYKLLLAFPVFWVLLEWSRSWLFTGFPWLSIGYTQIDSVLNGYAPLLSIYGVSLAVVESAALCVDIALEWRHSQRKLAWQSLGILLVIWLTGAGFSWVTWTTPFEKPIKVSLVQGNIPQEVKWSPDNLRPTLQRYEKLSLPVWGQSDIVIWPEGAIPIPLQYTGQYLDLLNKIGKERNTAFITGIPIKATAKDGYYNAIIAIGAGKGVYLKRRLVPFGEYTPFSNVVRTLLTSLNIPMSDFIPGINVTDVAVTDVINAKGVNIHAFVCYEIAFPEQVNTTRRDVNLLLTLSNDAWFGHSIAQAQHLQMARMRALELGRPVLFVSNDGLTAIIGANGKIQSEIAPFTPAVLTDTVQPREGQTPWQQSGLDPLLVIMICMLIYAFRLKRK